MSNTEAPPRDPHDRDPLDKSTIDCWRANYGLDKRTPAQAAKWWSDRLGGFAPSGCVAALGVALDELEALRALAQPAETDAELERRTGEPHVDGWPLYSGLPPAASGEPAETYDEWYSDWIQRLGHPPTVRDAWNATAQPAQALVPPDVMRDAERYRWLRFADLDDACAKFWPGGSVPIGDEFDAAIDAAMADTPAKEAP